MKRSFFNLPIFIAKMKNPVYGRNITKYFVIRVEILIRNYQKLIIRIALAFHKTQKHEV